MGRLTEVVCRLEFSITVLVSTTGIARGLSHSMGRHFFLAKKHKVAKEQNMLRARRRKKSDIVGNLID